MTEHLYYQDSFLYEFEAKLLEIMSVDSRPVLILDRTAFYPTGGGQGFDTGWLSPVSPAGNERLRVAEVTEDDQGRILHFVAERPRFGPGTPVHGFIERERRRDHMQQHSGQHVLSAAFVRLFNLPTVSFHMGVESSSIDLDAKNLTPEQLRDAESLANDVVLENRRVDIRFVAQPEARALGMRKIPSVEHETLRLIDIHDFDLTGCGGTHVASTGQIGCILLRKLEKVRQGSRVEFVCGKRAVAVAGRDYTTLVESSALCSSHIWELPRQIRKLQDDARAARKGNEILVEEVADFWVARLLAEALPRDGSLLIVRLFPDRELGFIKLLAQRLTRQAPKVVALLGTTRDQPALVFAQSAGQPFDMGALMKEVLSRLGGRGGGSKEMAQGGPVEREQLESVLMEIAARLRGENPLPENHWSPTQAP
ncbi:MAG TPA: DHHA1 domain-containing protein [Terriglobales bacterium]|nr:DHHA1 domain-containing protein [Terriglobales bacterium]